MQPGALKDQVEERELLQPGEIAEAVESELRGARFIDVHTHLYPPALGRLGLWGIDDLLTYHYLEAELFRSSELAPSRYWSLTKSYKADLIWQSLFVDHLPVSEATRGVVAVLSELGLPTDAPDLSAARDFFAAQDLSAHIDRVFALAGISQAVMTNDPLDPVESILWRGEMETDARFRPALRLDRLIEHWPQQREALQAAGYGVEQDLSSRSQTELRCFLANWCERLRPAYLALSLPDTFFYPEDNFRGRALKQVILPACYELKVPLSLMIGVRRQVNPDLQLAGDAAGRADLRSIENLCRENPENRFLVSVLSRENQHELCVYARKFPNLMPFGCWWFLNNPSIVEEITRERIEMLGMSFIPQHSDARILEQLIYKWRNTRRTLAPILTNTYQLLAADGRPITSAQIGSDIRRLFRDNYAEFCTS